MKRTLIAAASLLALAACQREPETEADLDVAAPAAEDVASEASAVADGAASGGTSGGSAMAPQTDGAIGAPPPINGSSGAAPTEAGGSVRPELSQRPPEDPTTETLARPETPMPQTTPDGRPAL